MCDSIRGLLAKVWKDEVVDLAPGTHYLDEVLTIHVSGSVQKQADSLVAATTSLPFLSIIAFLLEKSGVTREHSLPNAPRGGHGSTWKVARPRTSELRPGCEMWTPP